MGIVKKLFLALLLIPVSIAVLIAVDRALSPPVLDGPGHVASAGIPAERKRDAAARQAATRTALGITEQQPILFGDLHVHTTFSMDAFTWSMPLMNGTGMHPPADACDYARFCSRLDFWSTNEHSEGLTPRHWNQLRDMVQQCNAVSGDPADPDMVTFLGWEWTQMGNTPETHYGHRVVVMRDQETHRTPTRPIMTAGIATKAMRSNTVPLWQELASPYFTKPFDPVNRQMLKNLYYRVADLKATELCPEDIPSPQLPATCMEYAQTPGELQHKLREWGFPALVIPHGTTWGYYTPPGTKWDKQLSRADHDPELQGLIEIYSGHGNSEEYRDWRAVRYDEQGEPYCPEATDDYLPCCQRAGQIIESRCEEPGSESCRARVETAKRNFLRAGRGGRLTIPDTGPEDWLNCGQCTDCFLPAFNLRPGNSVQYIMQLTNQEQLDENGRPLRFRFGFIGSSDNHLAQPGVGYKEVDRHLTTDTSGAANALVQKTFHDAAMPKSDPRESVVFDLEAQESRELNFLQINESERQSAFFLSGGLVAVHSPSRDRNAIFSALQRRETYGTSGPRILLWFNLLQEDGPTLPMGSQLTSSSTPRFRVDAAGAFEQQPGCPQTSIDALGEERLEHMCGGECYNPADTRVPIQRIEIVRIRPRQSEQEDPGKLIEDPWRVFECEGDTAGCSVEFEDPDFVAAGRDTLYYARALQAPTPAINGKPLRCVREDENGQCAEIEICWGDDRTPLDDDCLAEVAERAWSSPIFLDYGASLSAAAVP